MDWELDDNIPDLKQKTSSGGSGFAPKVQNWKSGVQYIKSINVQDKVYNKYQPRWKNPKSHQEIMREYKRIKENSKLYEPYRVGKRKEARFQKYLKEDRYKNSFKMEFDNAYKRYFYNPIKRGVKYIQDRNDKMAIGDLLYYIDTFGRMSQRMPFHTPIGNFVYDNVVPITTAYRTAKKMLRKVNYQKKKAKRVLTWYDKRKGLYPAGTRRKSRLNYLLGTRFERWIDSLPKYSRKKRMFFRRRKRFYKGWSRYGRKKRKRILPTVQYLKKQVKGIYKKMELKLHEVQKTDDLAEPGDSSGTNFQGNWVFSDVLNVIPRDDTHIGRDAAKLSFRSIQCRFTVRVDTLSPANTFRMVLIYDKRSNKALPTVANVFESDTFNSNYNISRPLSGRFQFLMDKIIRIPADRKFFHGKFFKKVNLPIHYDGATGAIGEITQGALFFMLIGQMGNGETNKHYVLSYKIRIRYNDI